MHACPKCEYDLTGLPEVHNCPECGFAYDPHTVGIVFHPRRPWIVMTIMLSLLLAIALMVVKRRPIRADGWFVMLVIAWNAGVTAFRCFANPRATSRIILNAAGVHLMVRHREPQFMPWNDVAKVGRTFATGALFVDNPKGDRVLSCARYWFQSTAVIRHCVDEIKRLRQHYMSPRHVAPTTPRD